MLILGTTVSLVAEFETFIRSILSDATADIYGRAAGRFERWVEEDLGCALAVAPPATLSDFGSRLTREGFKATSVATYVEGAKQYLEFRRGRGEAIPAFAAPRIRRIEQPPPFTLAPAERAAFLEAAVEYADPAKTATMLLMLSGLRRTELATRKLTDLVWGKGRYWFRVVGKRGRERMAPIITRGAATAIVRPYLTGWRREIETDSEWLFPSPLHPTEHLSVETLRATARKCGEKIGVADQIVGPHDLRHTYATILKEKGVSPVDVARWLGHKDLNTTYRYYFGQHMDVWEAALDAVDL